MASSFETHRFAMLIGEIFPSGIFYNSRAVRRKDSSRIGTFSAHLYL